METNRRVGTSGVIETLHVRGISEEDLSRQVGALLSFVEIKSNQPIGRHLDMVTAIIVQKLLQDSFLLERFLDVDSVDFQLGILAKFFVEGEVLEGVSDMVDVIREGVNRIIPGLVSSPVIIATQDSRRVKYAVRGPIELEIDKQEREWYTELKAKLPEDAVAKFFALREKGFDAQREFLAQYLDEPLVTDFMQRMPIRVNIGNSFPYTRLSPAFIEALEARLLITDDSGKAHLDLDFLMPYSNSRGLSELAPLVHDKLVKRGIIRFDEPFEEWIERFIPTNGSSEAVAMAFNVLVEKDDDVLMIGSANYSLYSAQIQRRGANENIVSYDGGDITVDSILKALTPMTRLIVINSPNNPGGYIGKSNLVETVAEALRINGSRQITVLFDEAYGGMTFNGNHEDDLPGRMVELCPDQVIAVTDSLSKKTGALGPRAGSIYFIGPKENMPFLKELGVARAIGLCPNTFGQVFYSESLRLGDSALVDMKSLQTRMDVLVDQLRGVPGVEVEPAEGSLYVFPDVKGLKQLTGIDTSSELAMRLATEAHFSIVNGSGFGSHPDNDDRIRFVVFLPESTNRELGRRFKEWANNNISS